MNIEELSDMSTYDFQDFTPRVNDIFSSGSPFMSSAVKQTNSHLAMSLSFLSASASSSDVAVASRWNFKCSFRLQL